MPIARHPGQRFGTIGEVTKAYSQMQTRSSARFLPASGVIPPAPCLTSAPVQISETIAATTNKTGLTVKAVLDTNTYENGIKITDKQMHAFEARHLQRHEFHRSTTRPESHE